MTKILVWTNWPDAVFRVSDLQTEIYAEQGSEGEGEQWFSFVRDVIQIGERSDTSINSPSSTKFTLVFRKAQYFILSCRISQSYFQSQTCHHGVAVQQLGVIMTIYSSGSEELFFLQFAQREASCFYSLIASTHIFFFMINTEFIHLYVCLLWLVARLVIRLSVPSICYLFILDYFWNYVAFPPNYTHENWEIKGPVWRWLLKIQKTLLIASGIY